jgi:tRNA U34 5-methylaminomethyl-2-thiouridine-forming methyltransferase MnmC
MLRDELLSLRHRPFARPELSEREWLSEAGRVWEVLRTSKPLELYNKGTHKLHLWA